MSANDVHFFFKMREQIKLYHWQTMSYSRHKATDEVLEKLDEHIDRYVEVYMGKYGRPRLGASTNTTKLSNLSENSAVRFIKACIGYLLTDLLPNADRRPADTDLANIRDEMLAELNQLLYLFTLH